MIWNMYVWPIRKGQTFFTILYTQSYKINHISESKRKDRELCHRTVTAGHSWKDWHRVNAQLNVQDWQTVRTSAYIELFRPAQVHLVCSTWMLFTLMIPMAAVMVHAVFHLHSVLWTCFPVSWPADIIFRSNAEVGQCRCRGGGFYSAGEFKFLIASLKFSLTQWRMFMFRHHHYINQSKADRLRHACINWAFFTHHQSSTQHIFTVTLGDVQK